MGVVRVGDLSGIAAHAYTRRAHLGACTMRPAAWTLSLIAATASASGQCELATLRAFGGAKRNLFGSNVAISEQHVLVNTPQLAGTVYVYHRETGREMFELSASDGDLDDAFGSGLAVDGRLALIGAPGDDDRDTDSGAVYAFDLTTGTELYKLTAPSGGPGDAFGSAIAIHEGIAVVGAPEHDGGWGNETGKAYVFNLATRSELLRLEASNGCPWGDEFGRSVDLDDRYIVVGAPWTCCPTSQCGTVHVFDAATGAELVEIDGWNEVFSEFGTSVALRKNRLLIGAPGINLFDEPGSAHVYATTSWKELYALRTSPGDSPPYTVDRFGRDVAWDGPRAVVSGPGNDKVYVFEGEDVLYELLAPDPASWDPDSFGWSMAYHSETLVVGAPQTTMNGAAFLYRLSGENVGEPYCTPANPNSTGQSATISASGFTRASCNQMTLSGTALPPHQAALLLVSRSTGFTPFLGGGQGDLCLGGAIGRPQGGVQISDAGGRVSFPFDLADVPPSHHSIGPGETWHLQVWYRDFNPGPTSNLTDAVSVTFD